MTRDLARPNFARRPRAGAFGGCRFAGIVERGGEPLEPRVAGHSAGHRLKPKPEPRRDRRRARVAPRPRDEHLRRAQRAGQIVRRQADPIIEPRQSEVHADFRSEPRIRRGRRRPHAFVEAAEHHEVRLLQPRFEQTPDEDARMPAIGRPDTLLFEEVAKNGHGVFGADRHCPRRRAQLRSQQEARPPFGPRSRATDGRPPARPQRPQSAERTQRG